MIGDLLRRQQVWKFDVSNEQIGAPFTIRAPGPIDPCHFGKDPNGNHCLWAVVDTGPEVAEMSKRFVILGTGQPAPIGVWDYRGTSVGAIFVWHLFEEGEE